MDSKDTYKKKERDDKKNDNEIKRKNQDKSKEEVKKPEIKFPDKNSKYPTD